MRRADHATSLYPQMFELTSPTSGGRSVGIVRSRNKATELLLLVNINTAGKNKQKQTPWPESVNQLEHYQKFT
jgi:hypothetical protein